MKQKPLGAKNEKVMGIFLLLPKAFKNKYLCPLYINVFKPDQACSAFYILLNLGFHVKHPLKKFALKMTNDTT